MEVPDGYVWIKVKIWNAREYGEQSRVVTFIKELLPYDGDKEALKAKFNDLWSRIMPYHYCLDYRYNNASVICRLWYKDNGKNIWKGYDGRQYLDEALKIVHDKVEHALGKVERWGELGEF